MSRFFSVLIVVCVLWAPRPSEAQKVYRVGALVAEDQFITAVEGFKKKMTEMGYIDGKNIQYQIYNAELDREKLQAFAQKLVQGKFDLIVTSSTTATVPIAKLTKGIDLPVVFLSSGNPLEFVQSYASSGNNLTGISAATLDLTAKRLELLKELVPKVRRVASLNNPQGVNYRENFTVVQEAAKKNELTIHEVKAANREELVRVMPAVTRKAVDAIMLQPDVTIIGNADVVIKQAIREKLPLIPTIIPNVQQGGLATYAPDYFALGQQGALLVDKIFKGAKPSALPIEQPSKLNLVINLKTAKAISLKIPKEILLRADEVIE